VRRWGLASEALAPPFWRLWGRVNSKPQSSAPLNRWNFIWWRCEFRELEFDSALFSEKKSLILPEQKQLMVEFSPREEERNIQYRSIIKHLASLAKVCRFSPKGKSPSFLPWYYIGDAYSQQDARTRDSLTTSLSSSVLPSTLVQLGPSPRWKQALEFQDRNGTAPPWPWTYAAVVRALLNSAVHCLAALLLNICRDRWSHCRRSLYRGCGHRTKLD
jgi:hypothetical protein